MANKTKNKNHKCKQIEGLSVTKDSPTVSNKVAISSINALPANNKSFDKPPAKKRKYFKCSVKSDQHKIWKTRN